MKVLLGAVGAAVLAAAVLLPAAFAQSSTSASDFSTLIAWTEMQQPDPMQAGRQYPQQQTDPGRRTQPGEQGEMQQEPAAQTFAGTITKDGSHYVLKTSDNTTYKLDDQKSARKFEGKQVQVRGILNSETNLIQVQDIKIAS